MKTDNLYAIGIRVFLLRPQLMEPQPAGSDISCMAEIIPPEYEFFIYLAG